MVLGRRHLAVLTAHLIVSHRTAVVKLADFDSRVKWPYNGLTEDYHKPAKAVLQGGGGDDEKQSDAFLRDHP